MLDLAGDILNWLAAGVLFPLMMLPLAALAARDDRSWGLLAWLALAAAPVAAGTLFVVLAPRMIWNTPSGAYSIVTGAAVLLGALIFLAGGPRRTANTLARLFGAVTRSAGRIVMWLVLAMALVQFTVVILRYVFGINFIFMQESITYMHGAVFLLAGGYALLTDDHVRVDIFYRGASEKRKALIDFTGTYLFLFPVCLLILWTSNEYVGNAWAVREGSNEQSGIQGVFLLKSLVPAFAFLMAMAGFVIAARAGEVLRSGKA